MANILFNEKLSFQPFPQPHIKRFLMSDQFLGLIFNKSSRFKSYIIKNGLTLDLDLDLFFLCVHT